MALIFLQPLDTILITNDMLLAWMLKYRVQHTPVRETALRPNLHESTPRVPFQVNLSDEAVHLLFSANRWEKAGNIIKTLEAGTTIILDRYCYSGVAFSAAKGLDLKWCKSPDVGLPKPDKVFFLTMPFEAIIERKGFGQERYEILDFQRKVVDMYSQLKEENWDVLDANRTIEDIQDELVQKTLAVIKKSENERVGKIWVNET
ncbi:thymidylate kinase isoform X2 [Manduca sexta]|uniref:thymidylate kinase isoform X2 n=1 Tax=Manduca sexta TaxID=7130 RepID=UPI0011842BA6|nr:thymidylate kinase isoform X2 [Manduca sexta]